MSGWMKWLLLAVAGAALYDLVLRRVLADLLVGTAGGISSNARRADQVQ
jgi:hypothetical protein